MFKIYFCELVLGFLPDRNQTTAEMFSGKCIWIIIEKSWNFISGSQRGVKMYEKGGANFTQIAITLERNEISSPNSGNMCMTLNFGQIKKFTQIRHLVAL